MQEFSITTVRAYSVYRLTALSAESERSIGLSYFKYISKAIMLYSNWKLVVIIMKMVGLVVINNSGPLLWVVRGGWAKNASEIFNHWNGLQD